MTDREAYILLNLIPGVGPIGVRAMIDALGAPATLFEADRRRLRAVRGIGAVLADRIIAAPQQFSVAAELQRAAAENVVITTPADADYPAPLRTIPDPPLALYLRGAWTAADQQAVAVVGSRRMTRYGAEMAERFARGLAQCGFTVVSGLARGIDTTAHRAALAGGGRTLAVLGGALDRLYPPENASLAEAAAAHGAVISEFPFGREPDKTTFPMRNRLISGLSRGVLVVEAGLTSGALISAHQAIDQGRTVFAIPGRIDSPASQGAHALIKKGACLVESVDDVLDEFGELFPRAGLAATVTASPRPELNADETALLTALAEDECLDVDSLMRLTAMTPGTVNARLVGLELKRLVRMLPGRRVELIR